MGDRLSPGAMDLYRDAVRNGPLYGDITLSRTINGGTIVTCAPTTGLIDPAVLFSHRVNLEVAAGGYITIAGQVTYKITGWDPENLSLIVLLEEDHR
jgi:hypothetical protein